MVINFLKCRDTLRFAYGHLIKDTLVHDWQGNVIAHALVNVYWQGNVIVHALVKKQNFRTPLLAWMEDVPSNCLSFVIADLPD